jgi:predicted nucleic acid-binding protein
VCRGLAALFPTLLSVTAEHLRVALNSESPELGTADRLHVAVALAAGCEVILTTDQGFDGVAGPRRVDPLDAEAVAGLMRR